MVCVCCSGAGNPCVIDVDGEPVDIRTINPDTFLDITWNGAAVPDGTNTLEIDGVVQYSIPSGWWWVIATINTGFDSIYEYTSKWLQGGNEQWQFPLPDGALTAPLFDAVAISATECLLYGYCNVSLQGVPGRNGGDPVDCEDPDYFAYSSLWKWEATLTGGVVGAVTVIPIKGYKTTYAADEDGNCQPVQSEAASYGPTPVVTLTFAP